MKYSIERKKDNTVNKQSASSKNALSILLKGNLMNACDIGIYF